MGLFDNAGGLLDLFLQGQNPGRDHLADRANVGRSDFGKIAALGLPAIINAISRNTESREGLQSFDQALKKHEDVDQYQSFDELTHHVDENEGSKILGHVFNDQREEQGIIDRIADTIGIEPAAVKRVLLLLAPVVLKYMADRKKTNHLDEDGLRRETGSIQERMNGSLRDYLNPSKQSNNEGGILGDLFNSNRSNAQPRQKDSGSILGDIIGADRRETQRPQSNDGGLLDGILDLFK